MVPKPYFDNESRLPSSFSVVGDGKVKQTVMAVFAKEESNRQDMPRKRITEGMFVPLQGLVGSEFWHMYDEELEEMEIEMGDRAILLQSIQNYRKINSMANFKNFPENDSQAYEDPRFGEQVIVDTDEDICLGDVYEVSDSTLQIRVTAPRKPNRPLDSKNKTGVGVNGICHLTCSTGMAGWFCEVLVEGTMGEGSELVLMTRPHPKWTLGELARSIYGGEGNPKSYYQMRPSWGRSQEDLEELLAIPYFSELAWKETLKKIKRLEVEKTWPIPYLEQVTTKENTIASVLGVYGRGEELDEYMPRAQISEACFQPVQGLKGHSFWHTYDEQAKAEKCSERSVLLQTIQSYRQVSARFEHFPSTDMDAVLDPSFGEQVIIDLPGRLCVGDVLTVTGSTLKLRVRSPRKPCRELDNKSNVPYGVMGLRHFSCSKGLAGTFCEVMTEGKLVKGATIELTERPYPEWSVEEVAKAVYGGEGDIKALNRACGSWGRPIEQLHELLNNPYLAELEWKDELRNVLKKIQDKATTTTTAVATSAAQSPGATTAALRKRIGFFDGTNTWIPIILAFIIANISCLLVMASERNERETKR